ncbi:MAG: Uma2 family endonuclease [Bacteroidetes bacterium]|nr:MAG: Uma2 family endonuclease [Bacteroidota bacterium]
MTTATEYRREAAPRDVSPVRPHRWTRAAYDRMIEAGVFRPEDRVQLIDGEIVAMRPQGSQHATTIRLVEEALRAAFGDGYDVRPQLPLALGDFSEPGPDVAVVQGTPRDYVDAHPSEALLVVEVADATLRLDRTEKLRLYALHGMPEYWIVNLIDRVLEVHREPIGEAYRLKTSHAAGEAVAPAARPGASIPVADLLP